MYKKEDEVLKLFKSMKVEFETFETAYFKLMEHKKKLDEKIEKNEYKDSSIIEISNNLRDIITKITVEFAFIEDFNKKVQEQEFTTKEEVYVVKSILEDVPEVVNFEIKVKSFIDGL